MDKKRETILRKLVSFSEPLENISDQLSLFKWDYEGEPYFIYSSDLIAVLSRFLSGEIEGSSVERWADLIECRDDLDYANENHEQLREAIHILANPLINEDISPNLCQNLLNKLK